MTRGKRKNSDSSGGPKQQNPGEECQEPNQTRIRVGSPVFRIFQCYICPFFTPNLQEFIGHFQSDLHGRKCRGKTVVCNSGSCCFRSSHPEKVIDHLRSKQFHFVDQNTPACLLTLGTFANLMMDDEHDQLEIPNAQSLLPSSS
jgi:hypothetical protein